MAKTTSFFRVKIARFIRDTLRELKRNKIGIVGFTFLAIQILLLIIYPVVADKETVDNWFNIGYIATKGNPELAPPIWISYIDPYAPPPTKDLDYVIHREEYDLRDKQQCIKFYYITRGSSIRETLQTQYPNRTILESDVINAISQLYCKTPVNEKWVLIKIISVYNFNKKAPPLDVQFHLKIDIGSRVFNQISPLGYRIPQGFGVYVRRPDGIVISIVPGTKYPTADFDINQYADLSNVELMDKLGFYRGAGGFTPNQTWRLSLLRYISFTNLRLKEIELKLILKPLMDKANTTELSTNMKLFNLLFSQATPEALQGKFVPLTGNYEFEIRFLLNLKEEAINERTNVEVVRARVNGGFGLLGTDNNGRDLWSAIVYGLRWALLMGVIISSVTTFTATLYGVTSAYFGGKVDVIMQQIARIYTNLPALPLMILIMYSLRNTSIWMLISLLILFGWMGGQFGIRSMALQIREQTYIEAARALGASHARIVLRYVFPQVVHIMFVSLAFGIPGPVLTEAGLRILGIGDPTTVTWGLVLEQATEGAFLGITGLWRTGAFWWVISPGLALVFTSLTFIFVGQAIERIVEPRLRTR
ncbi:MAG: ABC transporter permease [Desulfurococcaceae archaeon]